MQRCGIRNLGTSWPELVLRLRRSFPYLNLLNLSMCEIRNDYNKLVGVDELHLPLMISAVHISFVNCELTFQFYQPINIKKKVSVREGVL